MSIINWIPGQHPLFNYVLDNKLFLEWLKAEGIAEQEHIKDIPLSVLEKLKLVEANPL
ncbi:hypothetical protein [Bacillus sp. ISL-4]|uniref:hypothetical protein n=1 Tax=Bacillus sp. ISL-4 TaxID=2819125 RepID=UPI00257022C1|nr:hypothetical protein [Bacillus sp. ISL-4]